MAINGKTRLLGLLGDPVQHTLSPLIHNTLSDILGINEVYVPFHTHKEGLADAVKGAFELNILGMNATVPHKNEIMASLVDIDEGAAAIGAVNTLVRTANGYKGYNTDMMGLSRELESYGVELDSKSVIILGAGGAARAVAYMCMNKGADKVYILNRTIEKAQTKIEGNNFGIRKNLLEYDQVMNDQREIIYAERMRVLNGENMRDVIFKMITDRVESCVDTCISSELPKEEWDLNELNQLLTDIIPLEPVNAADVDSVKNNKELKHLLKERAVKLYEAKETEFPEPEQFRELERVVLLKVIDRKWMDHIDDMDQLRQGIGLQAYGQRDPLVEYKMAGFDMFDDMIANIQEDTVRLLYHVKIEQKVEREQVAKVTGTNKDETATNTPKKRTAAKVYPNDPCPCGSGKKYKQCCGKMA